MPSRMGRTNYDCSGGFSSSRLWNNPPFIQFDERIACFESLRTNYVIIEYRGIVRSS